MLLFVVSVAWADPATVLAVGDGIIAAPPTASPAPTVPGGWVPVLADCLAERSPQKFTVVDRATPGETVASARGRAAEAVELSPALIVVALGAREVAAGAAPTRASVQALVTELRAPRVLLLPALAPPGASAAIEARVEAYDKVLAEVAGAELVPIEWPKDSAARGLLAIGGSLTDPGHARVAAAVCERILAGAP